MTLQEAFEEQYEKHNDLAPGSCKEIRMGDAYSNPRLSRAYRWFVRGRSSSMSELEAANLIDRNERDAPYVQYQMGDDLCVVDGNISALDWVAIGTLMGWIPEAQE